MTTMKKAIALMQTREYQLWYIFLGAFKFQVSRLIIVNTKSNSGDADNYNSQFITHLNCLGTLPTSMSLLL